VHRCERRKQGANLHGSLLCRSPERPADDWPAAVGCQAGRPRGASLSSSAARGQPWHFAS
jgi:hypothetical protein